MVDALAMAAVTAVLALVYRVATGADGEYLTIVSNLLFFEGGIVLTFGALVEFFHLKGTREIRRLLFYPRLMFERLGIFQIAGEDKKDEETEAGWALVFLGVTMIIFSILVSPDHLI